MKENIYTWLGVYRDNLPPEAVSRLQDILEASANASESEERIIGKVLPCKCEVMIKTDKFKTSRELDKETRREFELIFENHFCNSQPVRDERSEESADMPEVKQNCLCPATHYPECPRAISERSESVAEIEKRVAEKIIDEAKQLYADYYHTSADKQLRDKYL